MTPDHVAAVALFLASDASAEVSGEILGVAGSRVYAIRARETTGAFAEGPGFGPDDLRARWDEITRG